MAKSKCRRAPVAFARHLKTTGEGRIKRIHPIQSARIAHGSCFVDLSCVNLSVNGGLKAIKNDFVEVEKITTVISMDCDNQKLYRLSTYEIFVKYAGQSLKGTIISNAILYFSIPVLSRFYEASSFGTMQTIQNFSSILMVIATMRLDLAVLQAPRSELPKLFVAGTLISIVVASLVGCLIAVLSQAHSSFYHGLGHSVWLLPIYILVVGVTQIATNMAIREENLKLIALAKVAQSVTFPSAALLLGLLWPLTLPLVVADLIGRSSLLLTLLRNKLHLLREPLSIPWLTTKTILSQYRRFLYITTPGSVISATCSNSIILLITARYGASAAGLYVLIDRLIGMPSMILSSAMSQAYTAILADGQYNNREKSELIRKIVLRNILIITLPFAVLFTFNTEFVSLVAGPKWINAAHYLRCLIGMYFITFLTLPFNTTLYVRNLLKYQSIIDVSQFAILTLFWGWVFYSSAPIEHALIGISLIISASAITQATLSYRVTSRAT